MRTSSRTKERYAARFFVVVDFKRLKTHTHHVQYEGCSVAVNGTCLTVMTWTKHTAVFGVAPETLKRTNLDVVSKGDPVNLEHSLKMNAPNSGHYVQGHVDGTGTLANTWRENESLWVRISCSTKMIRGIVPKGYVAIDGTSLTVVEVGDSGGRSRHPGDKGGTESSEAFFTFMLVSHTQKHIALPRKKLGSPINIELDVMGKYADRAIAARIVKMENRICQLERVIKGEGVSSMITLGTLSALAVCIVALAKLR